MARKKRTSLPSANVQEYRRLRKNIIARMKYREKQGFKVDYTTKPQINRNPTKKDIERLQKYKVGLNKYGEVIADRPRSKAFERKDFKGATPSQLYTRNTVEYIPQGETITVNQDEEGIIEEKLKIVKRKSQWINYEEIGHYVNDVYLENLYEAYAQVYDMCYEALDSNSTRYPLEYRNAYYKSRWTEISQHFADIVENTPSQSDVVLRIGTKLADAIEMS